MLLQPILENATLHGLAPDGISLLKLEFSLSDKKLVCAVTDNGVGLLETRARQKKHQSKGLEILEKKVETINRRYNLGLYLDLQDLSGAVPPTNGTCAVVSFYPERIPPTAVLPKSPPQYIPPDLHHHKPANPT